MTAWHDTNKPVAISLCFHSFYNASELFEIKFVICCHLAQEKVLVEPLEMILVALYYLLLAIDLAMTEISSMHVLKSGRRSPLLQSLWLCLNTETFFPTESP